MRHFEIRDCSLLTRMSGLPAAINLRELRDRLAVCSPNVLYHHFCETQMVTSFDNPDYRNDFAVWVKLHLGDRVLAEQLGIAGPWWTKIDAHIPDHAGYSPGKHGELYIASLHPHARRPLKMELPKGTDERAAAATMQALAACAGDGRIPGYPYPLLDAHRTVVIDEPLVMQILQDIKSGLSKQGMQHRNFEDLFGDLHGDFERY